MKSDYKDIVIDIWGDFACFTRPELKVERTTYPIITPSAARNILCSIYLKPIEFYYEITKIEIMKPISYISITKNEVQNTIHFKSDYNFEQTQRHTSYLKNVYYRIYAKLIRRDDCPYKINIDGLYNQFMRRLKKGQCFYQPYLGLRECVCHFSEPDYSMKPLDLNLHIGNMLYDVFDITSNIPLTSDYKINDISFFDAHIENGTMKVPSFFSDEIRRIKKC